ncbi:hypothetical protein [Enterococcus mundtii]|uniref:hypothetical protein n=1 Tax=Enterococcus mundtii TaxID=53346 RepID=UPI00403C41DA
MKNNIENFRRGLKIALIIGVGIILVIISLSQPEKSNVTQNTTPKKNENVTSEYSREIVKQEESSSDTIEKDISGEYTGKEEALQNLITNWVAFQQDISSFSREYVIKHINNDLMGKNYDLTMVGFTPDSLPVHSGNTLKNLINEVQEIVNNQNIEQSDYDVRIQEISDQAQTNIQQLKEFKENM